MPEDVPFKVLHTEDAIPEYLAHYLDRVREIELCELFRGAHVKYSAAHFCYSDSVDLAGNVQLCIAALVLYGFAWSLYIL